jgi:tRNA (cmo5U34)-methyltransferase
VGQFHVFEPGQYRAHVRAVVPDYDRVQDEVVAATEGVAARAVLELGVGTGETSRRVLERHPGARLVGVDESDEMLAAARAALRDRDVDLRTGRFQDPLPAGPFDLAVSAFAVHHLDAAGKADLFARLAAVLAPGARFVLADVVVPDDPADAVTPLDGGYDLPDPVSDLLRWLADAGFAARATWAHRDMAVVGADLRTV